MRIQQSYFINVDEKKAGEPAMNYAIECY